MYELHCTCKLVHRLWQEPACTHPSGTSSTELMTHSCMILLHRALNLSSGRTKRVTSLRSGAGKRSKRAGKSAGSGSHELVFRTHVTLLLSFGCMAAIA